MTPLSQVCFGIRDPDWDHWSEVLEPLRHHWPQLWRCSLLSLGAGVSLEGNRELGWVRWGVRMGNVEVSELW